MRGLTVMVAGMDPERYRAALNLLATQAALGGRARLFLEGVAVALAAAADDRAPPGLPPLSALTDAALELGAEMILCQGGLAAAGLDFDALDPRFRAGGLTTILASLGDDRLVAL